jgi:glycerol-1-phosphate dehydrogenase [NAD(P)+]
LLCQTLVLSGFGMVLAGGSYPASQGEHLIAHMMEMAGKLGEETPAYHGEQIAITTLTMAALQYQLLERKPVLRETPFPKREMVSLLGKVLAQESSDMFAQKKMGGRKVAAMNAYIECHWDRIVERVSAVMIPEARLLQVLQQAGALCHPWQIGWDAGRYGQAVRYASFMRNRYTFLDILRQSSGSF